jgi:hypothetical protein
MGEGGRGVLTCEEVEGGVLGAWRKDCIAKKEGLEEERDNGKGMGMVILGKEIEKSL